MLEIPALVTAAWTVLQPLLPIIAAKGAEKLGESAGAGVWQAIQTKFESKPATKEALEELVKDPKDSDTQGAFRSQLKKLLTADAAFAAQLSKLVESAGSDYKAQVIGDGAIAQGDNAKAVGAGGIMIGGNVSGGVHQAEKKDKK